MSQAAGMVAAIISLLVIGIGASSQIWKNYKNKSCEGLSFWLPFTAFFSYSSWSLYGALKPDWFLLASQIPGAISMLVILAQFAIYKQRSFK